MSTFTRMPRTQLLVVTAVIIVVAMLFANVIQLNAEVDESGSVGGFIGTSVFAIAVTALLLLVAIPRIPHEHRRIAVLAFGVAAVVTVLIFYSALPFAFGAAAFASAGPADDSPHDDGPADSTAGVWLAALAIVAALVLCIIG